MQGQILTKFVAVLFFMMFSSSSVRAQTCPVHGSIDSPAFDVYVGNVKSGLEIGDKLQDALGGTFGPDTYVEGRVRYSTKIARVQGPLMSIPFIKGCNETFKQAAERMYAGYSFNNGNYSSGGGGVSGGGGNRVWGIVGLKPIHRTGTVCVSAKNCVSSIVLVGYDPIYGWIDGGGPGPGHNQEN